MTLADTARLLSLVQSLDNRKVDAVVAAAWHSLLEPYDLEDCAQVVREHYSRSRDWLMPADVIAGARRLRRERMAALERFTPNADPDDPVAYIAALREGRVRESGGSREIPDVRRVFRSLPSGGSA